MNEADARFLWRTGDVELRPPPPPDESLLDPDRPTLR